LVLSNTVHFLRKTKTMKRYKKIIGICAFAVVCFTTGGCGKKQEVEPIIMVDASEDEIVYNMEEITTGDVLLTKNVNCKYVQTNDQNVAFSVGGKTVNKVYVRIGEHVKVGDLLVELESGSVAEDIANLEYQINRNKLMLGYLDQAEEFDRQNAYFSLAYNSKGEEDDLKEYNEAIADIELNYSYQREDYNDTIEFAQKKLELLKKEYEGNRVYATMEGKVFNIKTNLEGSVVKKDEVVMTIVDNDNGLFEIEDAEAAKYFAEGQAVNMSIVYGDGKGDYELIPHNMSEWAEKQMFEILTAPESATLEVGVSGTIVATVDKRTNVTRIPISALYNADGKYYTYVLNAQNMRETRFIEVGLVGDKYAEVISGIDLGTKVVRR